MARLSALRPLVANAPAQLQEAPKVADGFYLTPEWRQARELCLVLHGFRCAHCPRKPSRFFVDHIKELQDGGAPYDQSNLEPLCGSCHTIKTGRARAARQAVDHRTVSNAKPKRDTDDSEPFIV
jgi:5-methylcytosine-specific restriction protein A